MSAEPCGWSLLQCLSDDVFTIISRSLLPRDMCNLSLCCRSLSALVASEKIWHTQCDRLAIVPHKDLVDWRKGVSSYKALYRFLVSVQPLIGIWVHQNPELGNVVYVMPGFLSVVGCRIIPQELGPLGIEDGPILWAPVFEIISDFDGLTTFFLHGREKGNDYLYPGSVKRIERTCNVLLLEVEPRQRKLGSKMLQSKSFVHHSDKEVTTKVCRSNSGLSRSPRVFGQNEDVVLLLERRSRLMQMCKLGSGQIESSSQLPAVPTQLEMSDIIKSLDCSKGLCNYLNEEDGHAQSTKRKSLGGYFRDSLKQILGKSSSINGSHSNSKKNTSSCSENKHAQLHEFLKSGDSIKLALHASTIKLSSYRTWPNMHDSRFALYKLPMRVSTVDQEYAGLWGGTFGWPPGKPTEDKPGKALFFLLLSYEESQGQQLLIATKILEGTHYVLHPNGSAMFIVNVNESSLDPFPWDTDADSLPLNIKHTFSGEGIANGYGFRYPGSKPGSLFVFQNGVLAFIWKESGAVLTLQRLNLQELLKKGERIPALPPIANFSYLTKSYSNVFAWLPKHVNLHLFAKAKAILGLSSAIITQ
ncbi:F-box family protein [Quillaja saponaria]|uniref:F-box family protein n=1 Tax=Quillaja saponaria TaxID=32244 RepID=A0AAD7LFJ5_QUISA|nr:F-box family protein [Quillaja saponaria]